MNRFLLLFSFCLFINNAFGQFSGIGANVGGNASEFVDETNSMTPSDQKTKFGANGGIKLEWNLFQKEWLKLAPELYIIQKGSKEYYSKQTLAQAFNDRNLNLDYSGICLPLKFEFNGYKGSLYNKEKFTWGYFQANIYADYTFRGSTSTGESIEFENTPGRIDYGFSANFAIGLNDGIFLQFGYQRGLKSINFLTVNQQNNGSNMNYIVQNKNFTIAIAFQRKI